MDDGLKQRLIGAVVLLALVVTFLPVLFDRETMEPVDRQSQVPRTPQIDPVVIDVPLEPKVASPAPAPEDMFVPTEVSEAKDAADGDGQSKSDSASPASDEKEDEGIKNIITVVKTAAPKVAEGPSLNPTGTPKSWVLQIASYSKVSSANKMRDRLIDDGYRAYTRQKKTSSGVMTRVYVGPKLDKRILLKDKNSIDKTYKIDSLLLSFTPN